MSISLSRVTSDLRVQWFVRSVAALLVGPVQTLVHWRGPSRLPQRHQRLYVRPSAIEHRVRSERVSIGRIADVLGKVLVPGDWGLDRRPLAGRKRRALIKLAQGEGPVQSGYVAWMEEQAAKPGHNHGCRTLEDILGRAAQLEALIADLAGSRRLRERREREPWTFRERGGIQVAVARDGTVMHVSDGDHRLAFCQTLELDAIPVSVLAVHPDAVRNGACDRLVETGRDLAQRATGDVGTR